MQPYKSFCILKHVHHDCFSLIVNISMLVCSLCFCELLSASNFLCFLLRIKIIILDVGNALREGQEVHKDK